MGEKLEPSYIFGGNGKCFSLCGKVLQFLIELKRYYHMTHQFNSIYIYTKELKMSVQIDTFIRMFTTAEQ